MKALERGTRWLIPLLLAACHDDRHHRWGVESSTETNENSPVGVNAPAENSPAAAGMMQDAMPQADPWSSSDGQPFAGSAPDGTPIPLSGQSAITTIFWGLDGQYPAGEYHLLYDGQGTIEVGGDAKLVSAVPGDIVFEVQNPTDQGIVLEITSSSPEDPVRNLQLLLPGEDGSQTFTDEFLAQYAQFSVIRFEDTGLTLEQQIELANLLDADAWFVVPYGATDAEVAAMAALIRDTLEPELQVYIEYENGGWSDVPHYAERSLEIFGIFEDVFGGLDRLVRILTAPSDDPATGAAILDWQQAYLGADALAIAPTFGVVADSSNEDGLSKMSVPELMALISASLDGALQSIDEYRVMAAARGLDLLTYGGGVLMTALDTAKSNVALANLFAKALGDKSLKDLYLALLETWREAGGRQFMHWAFTGEYGHSPKSPSYEALTEFIQNHPKWW